MSGGGGGGSHDKREKAIDGAADLTSNFIETVSTD